MAKQTDEVLCAGCEHGIWHHGMGFGAQWTDRCRSCPCEEFVPPPRVFEFPADAPWYVAVFHTDGSGPCGYPRATIEEEVKAYVRDLYDGHPTKKSFIACSLDR